MLARERLAHVRGESREDLVGRGALAVDHPVRGALRLLASGLERDRDDGGGDEREELRRPDERPDDHDDRDVHDRDERREQAVDDRLVDEEVDVVQAVLQDRGPDGRVEEQQRDVEQYRSDRTVGEKRDGEGLGHEEARRHEPFELHALVGPPIART